ncbi:MAG: Ig-like domain-containing protein [Microcoleaceae cyanobacterium]
MSLREAIATAAPGDRIIFDASLVTGTPPNGTINLTNGELVIDKNLTIEGPDTDNDPDTREITVDAGGNSRVFNINDGNNTAFSAVSISNLTIIGGALTGTADSGGGIYSRESLSVSNSTVSDNSAGRSTDGGGITSRNSTLSLTNSTVSGNTSGDDGGGIFSDSSTLSLTNSTISGNTAGDNGGGIESNESTLTLTNTTISANTANAGTGGITLRNGSLTLTNSTVSNNSAGFLSGGGINNIDGIANINDSTVSGNSALGGGGISNNGTLSISNSTLSGNTAGSRGGGIVHSKGTLSISNSTLSANSAVLDGGGIFSSNSTLTLTNSTIANNIAGTGGGVADASSAPSSITVESTIIASNTATTGTDVFGSVNDSGNNLIGNATDSAGFTASTLVGDATNPIDPLLGSLTDNGGLTQTQALQPGSPAFNAGSNPDNLTTDQRGTGFPRINDGVADIGAFESINIPPIAANVGLTTPIDIPVTVNLVSRDIDPDGTINPATYDLDVNTAGLQSSFTVAEGGFTITPQGILTFTPNAGVAGTVTPIQYTVQDNVGATSNAATVTVNVSAVPNQPPQTDNVFAPPPAIPGDAVQATLPVPLSGSDPDGTVASFQITQLPNNATLFLNGNAVTPNTIIAVAEAGNLTITPNLGFSGGFITFAYEAIDNQGANDLTPALYKAVVAPLDRPPETQDLSATVQQANPPVSVAVPTLAGTDTDGTVDSFRITSLPGNGTLLLNGNAIDTTTLIPTADAANLTFTPTSGFAGNATFNYVAIDNQGKEDPTPATIRVNVTPAANIDPDTANHISQLIDSGLTGVSLTPNLTGSDVDGTVDSFRIVTLPSGGTLEFNGAAVTTGQVITATNQAATLTYTPDPNAIAGVNNLTFTYAAIDNQSAEDSSPATYTIQIQGNTPPTANQLAIAAIDNTATNVALTPAPSGTDSDGTIASFTINQLPPATEGVLSVGGTAVTANQTLTPAEVATLTFTPNPNFTGISVFSYSVTDDDGAVSAPAQYQIPVRRTTPPDLPPTVNSITLAPIADANPVNIPALDGTDPEGDVLTFEIVTLPNSGQLLLNGTAVTAGQILNATEAGQLTFNPDATFTGTVSFTYNATDPQGLSASTAATVTIPFQQVTNQPPIANTVTSNTLVSTDPNTALTPTLSATDPDNDPVTFTITQLPDPSAGELLLGGNPVTVGQTLDATEAGQLTFTPIASFSGNAIVEYTATDNQGNISANTGQLQIPIQGGVVDLPPTVNSINVNPITNDITTPEVIPNLDGTDPEDGDPTSFTITTLPNNGTLLLNGTAVTLNQVIAFAEGGNLTYDPDNSFVGTDSFEYIATDSQGVNSLASATVSIPVNPGNIPPSAADKRSAPIDNTTTDAAVPDLTGSDADGTITGFRIDQLPTSGELLLNGTAFTDTSLVLTPAEAASLTYNPDPTFNGNATFSYVAIDNGGLESTPATVTLTVTAANLPPIPVNLIAQTLLNSAVDVAIPTLSATDPNGDTILEFTLSSLPNSGTLEFNGAAIAVGDVIPIAEAGNLTYTPDPNFVGDISFTYTATDAQGLISTQFATVTLPVVIGNLPPIPNNNTTTTEGTTPVAVPTLSATDPDGDTIASFTITNLPVSGTIQFNGSAVAVGDTINANQAGSLTYTANAGFVGIDSFDFTATDDRGAISIIEGDITFNVTQPPNVPPIAESFSGPILANTASPVPLPALRATDTDGTVTRFAITQLPDPSIGSLFIGTTPVTNLAQVANLTPSDAANLSFATTVGFAGGTFLNIIYTATDNDGDTSDPATLTVAIEALPVTSTPPTTPENQPPIAQNIELDNITNNGTAVPLPALTATDNDGTIVSYAITTLPTPEQGQLFLDQTEITDLTQVNQLSPDQINQLSYIPNPNFSGQFSLNYTATDNVGAISNSAAINLNVPNTSTGGGGGNEAIEALCDSPDVPNFTSFAVSIPVISEVLGSFESVITGTEADDILVGNQLANAILAELGNDIIDGETGNDLIDGGGGGDIIFANSGNDTVIGDDIVASVGGADAIAGNTGDDIISLSVGNDTLYGGVGNDFGYGGTDDDLMYGDVGNDTLFGDRGNDTLFGDRDLPNPTILEGQDILWGGLGDDFVDGNTGNDTVSGGAGEDTVRGGQQNDVVFGEDGNDLLYGDLGNDEVVGNEGNDTLYGGTGTSEIDTGNDTLHGGIGNDVMFAEDGRDIVCGDQGSDTLYGGGGSDTLIGGMGDDVLFGDEAADTLFGGEGSDGFVLSSNSGGDVILDFSDGVDVLRLSGLTFADLTITQGSEGTVIQQGNQVLATLEGVSLNLITQEDFLTV